MPGPQADKLNPLDLSALRPYAPAYLSGFRAEAYQMDVESALDPGKRRMDGLVEEHVWPTWPENTAA